MKQKMVIDLVSKFIEETREHPLNVTVSEAQLLHDFAVWVDKQIAQYGAQSQRPKCKCGSKNGKHAVWCN